MIAALARSAWGGRRGRRSRPTAGWSWRRTVRPSICSHRKSAWHSPVPARTPTQREHGHQVEQHEGGDCGEGAEHQRSPGVGAARSSIGRRTRSCRSTRLEGRRFLDAAAAPTGPTKTSAALATNGIRQPQARNSASLSTAVSSQEGAGRTQEPDRRTQLREHPVPGALAGRRVLDREQHGPAPFAAQAQPLSEPAQRQQQAARRCRPAHTSAATRSATVDRPIVSSAATSVALRPTRSPKWPNKADPTGRAKNASAKVASDCSIVAVAGSAGREEQRREHQHRRRGVDVEIEELDRRTDQAGEQHTRCGGRRWGDNRTHAWA
jgi:hypothetical protein